MRSVGSNCNCGQGVMRARIPTGVNGACKHESQRTQTQHPRIPAGGNSNSRQQAMQERIPMGRNCNGRQCRCGSKYQQAELCTSALTKYTTLAEYLIILIQDLLTISTIPRNLH